MPPSMIWAVKQITFASAGFQDIVQRYTLRCESPQNIHEHEHNNIDKSICADIIQFTDVVMSNVDNPLPATEDGEQVTLCMH